MRRTSLIATASLALVATAFAPSAVATAPDGQGVVVAEDLVTPLSLALGPDGSAFLTQNFAGLLTEVSPDGELTVIHEGPEGAEVGAVSVQGATITFATTKETRKGIKAKVWTRKASGASVLADVGAYEETVNPDGDTTYGPKGLSRSCKRKVPRWFRPYKGIVESHPYATHTLAGTTYLADAAANAVLAIAPDGTVSTVSVLPPVPVRITRKAARTFELPRCVRGHDYRFEPVPTDVEPGPDGMLYVSSLPGGPEDGSLGANGSVFRVDPATGTATKVVSGLSSPVGVAVSDAGDLYVSQLFAGSIVKVPAGTSTPEEFRTVRMPGDVEWTSEAVYATTRVLGHGRLVRFPLG